MLAGNGYAGESVWYDALSPAPFVAKCEQPLAPDAAAQCVRTVYLPSGIAAVYTFDASLLQSWRHFDPEMQRWLGAIGRSEEHTSELQSLMRNSYAVFCL